jgi:hypothetical protein
VRLAEAGTLSHGVVAPATAGVLLARGLIVPSDCGRGVSLTEEGRSVCHALREQGHLQQSERKSTGS